MSSVKSKIKRHLTSAHALALVAIFVSLSGWGAYAAAERVAKDSVVSKSIKQGAVRSGDVRDGGISSADVADGGVTGANVANDGITGEDVDESSLGEVPAAGSAAVAESAGNARTADTASAVAPNSVTGAGIPDDSLTGADIDESTLGEPMSGYEYVSATSPDNSASPKFVTVQCPAGKRVVFGGYDISGGKSGAGPNEYTDVVVDEFSPNADGRRIITSAYEEEPHAGNWTLNIGGVCINAG